MCKIGIKWQFPDRAVCAYAHDFRNRPGRVLIGACALIRANTILQSYAVKVNASLCNIHIYVYVLIHVYIVK